MKSKRIYIVGVALISTIVFIVNLLLLFYEVISYQQNVVSVYREKLVIQLIVFIIAAGVLLYITMNRCKDTTQRKAVLKKCMTGVFVIYIISVLFIVFRDISIGEVRSCASLEYYKMQLTYGTNFIPFRVFADREKYTLAISYYVQLIGNLVLFVPYGLLLPCLWKRIRGTKEFVGITLLLLFLIETIQFIFMCGSWDIDDILLNLFGALLAFGIFKWKLQRFFEN